MPDFIEEKETEAKKNLETKISDIENSSISKNSEAYILYVAKLKALNIATDEQYRKDGFGLDKELTFEKLSEFRVLYEECGSQGEKLLEELKDKKDSPEYKLIEEIQNMLSRDMKVLNRVDRKSLEAGTVSMQKIVAESRIKTVDISNRNLGTVGANMSSRIPFNYVEPDGKELPGVFTRKSEFDIEKDFDKFVDGLGAKAPHFRDIFRKFKPEWINFVNADQKKKGVDISKFTEGDKIYQCFRFLADKRGHITKTSVANVMDTLLPNDGKAFKNFIQTPEGVAEFAYFSDEFSRFRNSVAVNYRGAKITDKSRIDSRNSAMSAVADLLGMRSLICRAMPMKIKDGGKEIDGTFMAMAEGVDINHPPLKYRDNAYTSDGPAFTGTNGYKSVADLQVLDYICGNTDRHAGNMFYKFNNGKFSGVQGIDNDTSFGTLVPSDDVSANGSRFVNLDNLKVISRSAAERVMALDTQMLKYTLREHDLSDRQVEAACKRLEKLKDYISKSMTKYENLDRRMTKVYHDNPSKVLPHTVRIVDDDKFDLLELDRLQVGLSGGETNAFTMVGAFHDLVGMKTKGKAMNPEKVEEKQLYVMKDEEANWAAGVVNKLSLVTSSGRTSENFIAIQKAAQLYKSFCENNRGAVLSEDLYNVRKSYLEGLTKAANTYLLGKRSVKKPSRYTRSRIEAVTDIFGEAGVKAAENYYGDMKKSMGDEEYSRYADGLNKYADKSLDEFNAKMRRMAQEIAKKNGQAIPEESRAERIEKEAKTLSNPLIS